MKHNDKEVITYFPAENVAGMYLVLEGSDSPILLTFEEFTNFIKSNQEE